VLQSGIDSMRVGCVLLDERLVPVDWNRSAEDILQRRGYPGMDGHRRVLDTPVRPLRPVCKGLLMGSTRRRLASIRVGLANGSSRDAGNLLRGKASPPSQPNRQRAPAGDFGGRW